MFTHRVTVFRAFGFPIRIDVSWLFIAAVLTWSLASAHFPRSAPGYEPSQYWVMGLVGMLGLFASVVLHELGHALVARRFGLEMSGITLFIFGGVAEMTSDPPSPKAEFWVAVGGPLVSLVLAGLFWAVSAVGLPASATAVAQYLGFINGVLLVFNLVPAFPLDGGRVLRSILWQVWGSLRRSTRVVAAIGGFFGYALIGLGLVNLFAGSLFGAVWWTLLGFFVKSAASMSYQQVLTRKLLEGERVWRFMRSDPVTVRADALLDEVVEECLFRHPHQFYPVVDADGQARGYVTARGIKEVPKERWVGVAAEDIAQPLTPENSVSPSDDAVEALERMHRGGLSRLLVVVDGRLVGLLALRDMMRFLAMKIDLGENEPGAARLVNAQAQRIEP